MTEYYKSYKSSIKDKTNAYYGVINYLKVVDGIVEYQIIYNKNGNIRRKKGNFKLESNDDWIDEKISEEEFFIYTI